MAREPLRRPAIPHCKYPFFVSRHSSRRFVARRSSLVAAVFPGSGGFVGKAMHGDVQKVEHDRRDELTRFSGRSGLAMIAVVIGLVLVASGCGTTPHQASLALATFAGHGSIEEAYVIGAPPGKRLNVLDASGKKVGSGVVDNLGGLIVTNLTPGPGVRFEDVSGG